MHQKDCPEGLTALSSSLYPSFQRYPAGAAKTLSNITDIPFKSHFVKILSAISFDTHWGMASSASISLQPPVRVLIQARLIDLMKYHPCVESADTELIERLHSQLFDSIHPTEIRHVITRISDRKRMEQVDIVLDCHVPTNDSQPKVAAFQVKFEDSIPHVTPVFNPHIRSIVNRTIEVYATINSENLICFPRRVDIRAEILKKRRAPMDNIEASIRL